MKKGGKNDLHVDNYNKKYSNDYSAILYLTDSYSGGEINFPERKLNIKPKPGTLITFIGTKDLVTSLILTASFVILAGGLFRGRGREGMTTASPTSSAKGPYGPAQDSSPGLFEK